MRINDDLSIPEDEISYSFSRSGGPGGQNVNKVNSKVALRFDLRNSSSLTEEQKHLILERLANRISKEGVLSLASDKHRSQCANRNEVLKSFAELLRRSLTVEPKRISSGTPRNAKERRLEEKRRRGQKKKDRSKNIGLDE